MLLRRRYRRDQLEPSESPLPGHLDVIGISTNRPVGLPSGTLGRGSGERVHLRVPVNRRGPSAFIGDVLERLAWLFATRGIPEYLRSDNGSEFTCTAVRFRLAKVGVRMLFIEPGSPWENGYVESFGELRDELLDREIFYTLLEAKVLIERWREHYNRVRPHRSLG